MTADEITDWVKTLSAAADAEERGRQARLRRPMDATVWLAWQCRQGGSLWRLSTAAAAADGA